MDTQRASRIGISAPVICSKSQAPPGGSMASRFQRRDSPASGVGLAFGFWILGAVWQWTRACWQCFTELFVEVSWRNTASPCVWVHFRILTHPSVTNKWFQLIVAYYYFGVWDLTIRSGDVHQQECCFDEDREAQGRTNGRAFSRDCTGRSGIIYIYIILCTYTYIYMYSKAYIYIWIAFKVWTCAMITIA